MKKIALIGHDLKFVQPLMDYLAANFGYDIRIDHWNGHDIHNVQKSQEMVEWADILFCEWGLGNVVWYQQHKRNNQKLVVRLHRFEMNTDFPKRFDYAKIDQLIAISPYIFEEFHRVAKVPRDKMTVIYNAVDTARFQKPKVNKDVKFNIGIIGIVPKLKRLDRAVDILESLYIEDQRFKLFIKGKHPKEFGWIWNDPVERAHYEAVVERIANAPYKKNIFYEGWGDVSQWLTKIGYVLSVSDYESFHMAPVEGMASGSCPIVLKREGVNTVFPKEYIFENLTDIKNFILRNNTRFGQGAGTLSFVQQHYSLERIGTQIDELLKKGFPLAAFR